MNHIADLDCGSGAVIGCAIAIALLALGAGVSLAAGAARDIKLPPETAVLKPSALPGYKIAQEKCGICHSVDYISLQPPGMTLAQWTAELVKMRRAYGAPIDEAEINLLGIYLASTYGDAAAVAPPNPASP